MKLIDLSRKGYSFNPYNDLFSYPINIYYNNEEKKSSPIQGTTWSIVPTVYS